VQANLRTEGATEPPPQDIAAPIERFNRGMGLILPLVAMPIEEFLSGHHAPLASAQNLLRVGDFLYEVASAMEALVLREAA